MQQDEDRLKIYNDRGLAKNVAEVHGVNPVLLIEKIVRERIQDSIYWKLNCFGIDSLRFVEKASDLQVIASGNQANQPSHFQCLLLKLLQIQPNKEIMLEFLNQKYFKYLSCIAMFYIRLCYKSKEVYELLEPFYNDYRKIRFKASGAQEVQLYHIDELVHNILHNDRVCGLILPRLVNRVVLEDNEQLLPRVSELHSDSESGEEW